MEPTIIKEGLAFYLNGPGAPLFLMPYPHGYTLRPVAESPLAHCLVEIDRQVITFDPPGTYRSSRPARLDMAEMLQGAQETLETFQVNDPIDLAGHSMGGLCALAFALEYPQRVRRLVLIGSIAGGPAIQRCKGMPRDRWPLVARRLDYSHRLGDILVPTLVCVGRHDPQAPVGCSQELAQGISDARLIIFERSGHYPFLEEPQRFTQELQAFLQ